MPSMHSVYLPNVGLTITAWIIEYFISNKNKIVFLDNITNSITSVQSSSVVPSYLVSNLNTRNECFFVSSYVY